MRAGRKWILVLIKIILILTTLETEICWAAGGAGEETAVTGRVYRDEGGQYISNMPNAPSVLLEVYRSGGFPVELFNQRRALTGDEVRGILDALEKKEKGRKSDSRLMEVDEKLKMAIQQGVERLKREQRIAGETDLEVKKIDLDELGITHIRMQQKYQGMPIYGRELLLHVNEKNEFISSGGEGLAKIKLRPASFSAGENKIDSSRAAAIAVRNVGASPDKTETSVEEVWYDFHDHLYKTYLVKVSFHDSAPHAWRVFVDQDSGKIIDKFDAVAFDFSLMGEGTGVHGDHKLLNLRYWDSLKWYVMYDTIRHIWTNDNYSYEDYAHKTVFWGTDQYFNDLYDAPAVDAHYYTGLVNDYLAIELNRAHYDGLGLWTDVIVHYGISYNNAFYDPNKEYFVFGDGDGVNTFPFSAGLDVVAHEITHGMIDKTCGLIGRRQSGALAESICDTFGTIIESKYQSGQSDWLMGEDIYRRTGKATRSMENPPLFGQPDHMSAYVELPDTKEGDWGGVHLNCGIPNKAAYLILKNIGWQKTGKIYYRALKYYLTPLSEFLAARGAFTRSAEDLYGSNSWEKRVIQEAFNMVGISVAPPVAGVPAGTYYCPQTVTLTTATAGAAIYYTLDGSEPTTAGTLYTGPININRSTTLKAIAKKDNVTSDVSTFDYLINEIDVPTVNIPPGTYYSPQTVTLSTSTPGAVIYYTVDGSTPTTAGTLYTGPVTISQSATLKAIAARDGGISPVGVFIYTIAKVAAPAANPPAGTYYHPLSITLSTSTPGANIYYTLDGSEPTIGSTLYNGPIPINGSTTIKAIAGKDSGLSDVSVFSYVIEPVKIPQASPSAGAYYSPQTVTLSSPTAGAAIYYTLDGSEPTTGSLLYTGPITIAQSTTIKAVAVKDGGKSEIATFVYSITFFGETITGRVRLEGLAEGQLGGVEITVPGWAGKGTTDSNGAFTLANLPEGTQTLEFQYKIHGQRVKYLLKRLTVTIIKGYDNSGAALDVLMKVGDINGDNLIELADLGYLAASYGASAGTPGFNANCDFNDDDVIELTDLGWLASNYGLRGDTL